MTGKMTLEGTRVIEINPDLPKIGAKANVKVGWVKEIDIPRACSEGLKESRHVQ